MAMNLIPDDFITNGDINSAAAIARSKLATDTKAYRIPLINFTKHDAVLTALPTTPLTDDLGLVIGTFGTNAVQIQTEDLKAAGATNSYARAQFVLPPEYVAAGSVVLRCHAGMVTTVSDTTATLDVTLYSADDDEGGVSADLCATAATTINSLTQADIDFTITATTLSPGDLLDFRIHTAVNDGATGTAVKATIGSVAFMLAVKG